MIFSQNAGIDLRDAHGVLVYRAQVVHASYVTGVGGLFEPLRALS